MTASRLLNYIIAGVAITALLVSHTVAYKSGASSVQSGWDRDVIKRTNETLKTAEKHRKKEREWQQNVQSLQDQLHKSQGETRTALDAALADITVGSVRLRERFACPSGVPKAATATGSDNGASGGGLSDSDQEFLIRIGGEADQLVHRLRACQGYIASGL